MELKSHPIVEEYPILKVDLSKLHNFLMVYLDEEEHGGKVVGRTRISEHNYLGILFPTWKELKR